MYNCQDCGKNFLYVKIAFERHGLDSPPYERLKLCPFCDSASIEEVKDKNCRFCGSRLKAEGQYCSDACRINGEKYYERDKLNKSFFERSPLCSMIKELAEYNKAHGTRYSYGQYISLKEQEKI